MLFFFVGIAVVVLVLWQWPEAGLAGINPDLAGVVAGFVFLCGVWVFNSVYLSFLVPESESGAFIRFRLLGVLCAGVTLLLLTVVEDPPLALNFLCISLWILAGFFIVRAGLILRRARSRRLEEIAREG